MSLKKLGFAIFSVMFVFVVSSVSASDLGNAAKKSKHKGFAYRHSNPKFTNANFTSPKNPAVTPLHGKENSSVVTYPARSNNAPTSRLVGSTTPVNKSATKRQGRKHHRRSANQPSVRRPSAKIAPKEPLKPVSNK